MRTNQARLGSCLVLALVVAGGVAPRAQAVERYWTSTADGTYSDSGNWLNGQVPGGLDNANFTSNANYAVTWGADASVSNAYFNPKSGTVTLNLGSAVWTVTNLFSTGDSAGTTGTVVQTGGRVLANGTMYVGNNGQGFYTLSNGTIVAGVSRIRGDSRMVVTGSGSVVTNTGLTTVGYYAPRGGLTVADGGFLRAAGGLVIGGGNGSATGSTMLVTGTGTVSTTSLDVGIRSGGYGDGVGFHQLVVTNGGRLYATGIVKIGWDATATGCVMVVTGQGSIYSNTVTYTAMGNQSPNNRLIITNGGTVAVQELHLGYVAGSNNLVLVSGSNSTLTCSASVQLGESVNSKYHRLIVNNGGRARMATSLNFGYTASGDGQEVTVSDPGSVLDVAALCAGDRSAGNRLVVTNGGRVNLNGNATVSARAGATPSNNTVVVTGANSMMWLTRTGGSMTLTVGITGTGRLLVTDQGTLELQGNGVNGSKLVTGAYGVVTNWGGIYQFAGGIDANQIVNGTPGSIVITNGTVSFRAFTTASVFCNQAGQPLDSASKLVWLGDNTFRLNTATNAAGQNYTFQTGTATNFAGLSLINGSRYQGNVTIGTGGTLSFAGGKQTLSGNLAMQSAGKLAATIGGSNDYLTVTSTANLGGAQLQVALGTDPTPLYPIRFLRTGGLGGTTFGVGTVSASYAGTNYDMKVTYQGNDALLSQAGPKGTTIMVR